MRPRRRVVAWLSLSLAVALAIFRMSQEHRDDTCSTPSPRLLAAGAVGPASHAPKPDEAAAAQRPLPDRRLPLEDVVGLSRRSAAMLGASLPLLGADVARAEQFSRPTRPATEATQLERVTVAVQDEATLSKEIKFWTDTCLMNLLEDTTATDGNRSLLVGFGTPSDFAIRIKINEALKQPRQLLDYNTMQPLVNALNFIEIRTRGKAMEVFNRIELAGGYTQIGDATWVDCESPGGIPVRFIVKQEAPSIDFIGLNVEVTAFEGTSNFYQRGFAWKDAPLPTDIPAVQKRSVLFKSPAGGPGVLLSPVPDRRLKDRKRDFFLDLTFAVDNFKALTENCQVAIDQGAADEAVREELLRTRVAMAPSEQKESLKRQLDLYLKGTRSSPYLMSKADKVATYNDGIGTKLVVSSVVPPPFG